MDNLPTIVKVLIEALLVIWLLAAIANKPKREKLKDRLSDLITVPTVYNGAEDKYNNIEFYPRNAFEIVAKDWKNSIVTPVAKWISDFGNRIAQLQEGIIPEGSGGWKSFNYFILLLIFVGFLFADAITVTNTLEYFSLAHNITDILKRYDIAILFGSLISVVVGGIIANDVFGKGEFSDWGLKRDTKWIWFARIVSPFLMLSGIYLIASLGASRFGGLVELPANVMTFLERNGQIVLNILTPINAALATALIAEDGLTKGLKILALMCMFLLLGILIIAAYVITIIISTVIYLVDVTWRFTLGLGNIIFYLAFTPIDEAIDKFSSLKKA